jgi:hypothetical protein
MVARLIKYQCQVKGEVETVHDINAYMDSRTIVQKDGIA